MITKLKKNDKYPIKTELTALPRAQRKEAISLYIRNCLRNEIPDIIDDLRNDEDFKAFAIRHGLAEIKIWEIFDKFVEIFKRDLNIHLYYFEKEIDCIDMLSARIEHDLFNIFCPDPLPSIAGPRFSEAYWPWKTAETTKKKSKKDAIFLLSCPRSGSTIFRLILAAHPGLFAPPELHLLPFDHMANRGQEIDELGFGWMRAGVAEALADAKGISLEQAYKEAHILEQENKSIPETYDHLQSQVGDRLLIDKTPFYPCHIDWLNKIEDTFENPKYLFLTRHPFGMISSFVKLRLQALTKNNFGCDAESPWHLGEKWWLNGNQNIKDFLEKIPQERHTFLRYEDLIASTEDSVNQICQFLNIEFNSKMLNPYANNTTASIRGVGDPNIMDHNHIDSSLADNWKKVVMPQTLSKESQELAEALGYTCYE